MSRKKKYRGTVEEDNIDELPESFWENAEPGHIFLPKILGKENAEKLMSGKVGRPRALDPKQPVKLRLDSDVLAFLRSTGKGWQTRVNKALRELMEKGAL